MGGSEMRKKRLLSLALVAALSVTMLAGCGGKKSTESETNKDGSEKVKITLGIWPGEDLAENIPTFEGYQKTMKKLHPNVTCRPSTLYICYRYIRIISTVRQLPNNLRIMVHRTTEVD